MKKRILYIILGVMLLSNVGVGQGFISFNGIQNYIYNGSPQFTRTSLVIDYGTSDDDSPITVYSYSGNSFSGTPYGPSPNKPINAGNYTVTATVTFNDISGSFNSLPVSFTIAKSTPILTVTNPTLTYTANAQSATVSSSVAGNFPTPLKYNGSTTIPTNAGTYTITADFVPSDVSNYNSLIDVSAGSFTINKAPVTISDILLTKIYDGNPTVNVISNSSSGIISGDNVVITGTASNFSDKVVANNYSSTVTFNLVTIPSTGKEDNYFILGGNQRSISNGTITAKALSIAAASIAPRGYDGTRTVGVITKGTLTGFIGTETVTANAVGTDYVSGNVGTYTSTISYTLANGTNGGLAGNYSLANEVANGTITAKALSIAAASIAPRGYDGTRTVGVITKGALTGFIGTETVTANAVGTDYVSGIVGTYTSTISYTLANGINGGLAGNYSLVNEVANGTITKLPITLTASANTKVYDGTLSATATPTITTGSLVSGDIGVFSETYDTKTQGSNKVLTPAVVSILDATNTSMVGNYSITYETNTSGVITAKQLMITDPTFTKSKEYDKTVTVNTIAGTLSGVVTVGSATDAVTVSSVGTYSTSTVGTGKTITVAYTLAGADKDNYIKPVDKVYTDGVITAKQLTITDPTIIKSKEYDKTITVNTAAGTLSGVVTVGSVTDVVTASAVGTYSTSSVGAGKTITVSYTLDGVDKDNYIKPVDKVYTDGVITAKQLTITDPIITKSKEYDKTVTVNTTAGTLSGVVIVESDTDAVTASAEGTYSSSTVGTNKTIMVVYTLAGADKDNYIKPLDKVYTDGEITAKPLTVTGVTTSNKVYDGTNIATLTGGTLVGVISPDVINFTASGTFSQSTVGTGIAIISTSTIDNTNYSLTQPTLTARDITAKPLTVTAKPGQTKVFGTPDPPNFTYTLSTPLLGSDVLTGALKRTPGEAIGPYAINQGTLTNLNYGITYISNNFEITPAPVNNTGTTKAYDLPNAFTPNGDGKNDKFKIIVNDPTRVNLISFQIYNRNGTLMFTTNKISEGWDGRYKGVMQDMGIYFVKLITLENGLETPRLYLLK